MPHPFGRNDPVVVPEKVVGLFAFIEVEVSLNSFASACLLVAGVTVSVTPRANVRIDACTYSGEAAT